MGSGGRGGGHQFRTQFLARGGGDHPPPTADGDHRDRSGSIHAAAATANGEQSIRTERHAAAEHAASDGIEERNEERHAGFFGRTVDFLGWHHHGASGFNQVIDTSLAYLSITCLSAVRATVPVAERRDRSGRPRRCWGASGW